MATLSGSSRTRRGVRSQEHRSTWSRSLPGSGVTKQRKQTGSIGSAICTSVQYDLVVNAAGFTQTSLKGVAIELNKTATQNVTLAVGQLSQSVEVVEATETITRARHNSKQFHCEAAADLPVASLAVWRRV